MAEVKLGFTERRSVVLDIYSSEIRLEEQVTVLKLRVLFGFLHIFSSTF